MSVVFRADASLQIGSGHVMRCLTMADALQTIGIQSTFICRAHAGHLAQTILSKGHKLELLDNPADANITDSKQPAHASWLGTRWQDDAQESLQIILHNKFDWIIVDHYALDINWEQQIRCCGAQLMVIDDLVDRKHDCDILLDQTYGRTKADYKTLVPKCCTLLTGTNYALLRPEFAQMRKFSLERRKHAQLKHILITMGGVDLFNSTGKILSILQHCPLPEGVHISIIMGATAPYLSSIQKQAEKSCWPVKVMTNVNNMAQIMAASDLCIGAAGSTSWERCCLGLPSLMVVLADNQKDIADALEKKGACINLGDLNEPLFSENAATKIKQIVADTDAQKRLSDSASQINDGEGIKHILSYFQDKKTL